MAISTSAPQPLDENHYNDWRLQQSLVPAYLLLILSAPVWAVLPLVVPAPDTGIMPQGFYWFCWAYAAPVSILGLVIPVSPLRRYIYLIAIPFLLSMGLGTIWFLTALWDTPHGIAASGLWYCLICSFIRLPTKYTACVAIPITALAAWMLLEYHGLAVNQVWGDLTFLAFGALLMCVFAFMNENLLRQSFSQQQTIARQHDVLKQRQQETEASRNLIRRYVPPAVAESIIAGREAEITEPQRRRVTVLFSDIVGFTDMADRLDAESMTQILNEYMAAMAELVEQHDGTLNEFSGDGLMSVFGAPKALSPEDQVLNAVRAAQKMQALLPELNNRWRKLGIGEPLKIRVGINTGVLSVGSFGSAGRMTYTAIGLQTNIAARIESKAEPGEVLISDASYQLISDQINCEPRGEVECKGVHFPVKVYAPKGSKAPS